MIENLLKKITSLEEIVRLNNKHTYGSKSQKCKSKKTEDDDHTKNEDDFDGTQESLGNTSSSSKKSVDKPDVESEKEEKEVRLYRQGKKYRTMTADKSIFHECDIRKLSKDAIIIKRMWRYFRYLNTFWIQLFAYTHDGSYTIDNSITECFSRTFHTSFSRRT